MKKTSLFIAFLGLALIVSQAHAATLQDIENSFNPYAKGFPVFNGLKPGMVIQKNILDQFKAILDPGLVQVIANGWYEV